MEKIAKITVKYRNGMLPNGLNDILQNADFLPERLVVQPMKNPEKVRITLLKLGYKLIKDYTFKDCKYYDLIVCERGEDFYFLLYPYKHARVDGIEVTYVVEE